LSRAWRYRSAGGDSAAGLQSELKEASPAYEDSFLKKLHELESSEPENALVEATLGHQALAAERLDEAEQHFEESLKLDPAQPEVYSDLSEVGGQKGGADEALTGAQKAVALDPFNAPQQKTLVTRRIDAKRYPEAAMEKYLENFPEDDFMRKMLAIARQDS
jgi:tetratricopeptide (TPR) repeat protein